MQTSQGKVKTKAALETIKRGPWNSTDKKSSQLGKNKKTTFVLTPFVQEQRLGASYFFLSFSPNQLFIKSDELPQNPPAYLNKTEKSFLHIR